ncbi:hypothetical protein V5E97_31815 [Singulisphaera sp. Ch08]|uniref:Uncharacterized protein n=1 Tax=Singulisphaera sp. Ch08 TaxID=3120278 RepID=A0AAU7CCK4_9BACT
MTWLAGGNRATNAPYRIYDGTTLIKTVRVDQRLAPAGGVTTGGVVFQSLGVVSLSGGTLRVVLGNDADNYVIADAIRVAAAGGGAGSGAAPEAIGESVSLDTSAGSGDKFTGGDTGYTVLADAFAATAGEAKGARSSAAPALLMTSPSTAAGVPGGPLAHGTGTRKKASGPVGAGRVDARPAVGLERGGWCVGDGRLRREAVDE